MNYNDDLWIYNKACSEITIYNMKENKTFWLIALSRDIKRNDHVAYSLKRDIITILLLCDVDKNEILSMSTEEQLSYLYLFVREDER